MNAHQGNSTNLPHGDFNFLTYTLTSHLGTKFREILIHRKYKFFGKNDKKKH